MGAKQLKTPDSRQPEAEEVALAPHAGRPAENLYRNLEAAILSGEYPPNSRLPTERKLIEKFKVSRTVVREVVLSLEKRGLLERRYGHRPLVRKPSFTDALASLTSMMQHTAAQENNMRYLFESRIFIETALARRASQTATKEDISLLHEALENNRKAMGSSNDFYATDVAFHGVLYRIPRNPIFPALHQSFVAWLSDYWQMLRKGTEIHRFFYSSHAEIFDAINDRSPDEAEKAMRRHLEVSWGYIKALTDDLQPKERG